MKGGGGMNKISAEKNILSYALNEKIRCGIISQRIFLASTCKLFLNGQASVWLPVYNKSMDGRETLNQVRLVSP